MATSIFPSNKSFYSYSSKRNLRQEEIAAYKRIGIATLIIVGLLVAGYFLSIPILSRLGAGNKDTVDTGLTNQINSPDTVAPSSPKLNGLPDAVKNRSLNITGSAESGSTVVVTLNDQESFSTVADSDGMFEGQVTLKGGSNSLSATAKDAAGNVSRVSKIITITYDANPPKLLVTAPLDQATSTSPSMGIAGSTESTAVVTVNDRQIILQSDGSFTTTQSLTNGQNVIAIVATDKAGNATKVTRTVIYDDGTTPQTAPTVAPTP